MAPTDAPDNAPSGLGSGPREWAEGEKEALIARAVEMRLSGANLRDIESELGVDKSTLSRFWLKDVKKPKKAKKKSQVKHASEQKRQQVMDRARNRVSNDDPQTPAPSPVVRVLTMPEDPTPYRPVRDKGGDWTINPDLLNRAVAVLRTWTADHAAGRMVTVPYVERHKAVIVIATAMPIHDWAEFGNRRELWRAIRELSGVNRNEVAERCGISGATQSRWESGERTPEAGQRTQAHAVYKGLQETAIVKSEWALTVASYIDSEHDGNQDVEVVRDEVLQWVAGDSTFTDLGIGHIQHLASIRAMMSRPAFREPTPSNLWLTGFWTPATVNA